MQSVNQGLTDIIPLSSQSKQVLDLVSAPIQTRKHTSYNRNFLDQYRPPDGKRPAGTYVRQIFGRLLLDLTWNSSRLEGNTYSLLETERLIQFNEPAGKNLQETQMILNHKAAIEFLVDSAGEIGVNRFTILNLHALLSNNLLNNPKACGSLRSIPVGIGKSVYIPTGVPQLIHECFTKIVDPASSIKNPFEQAFFMMVHIPYLQPFEDVNKRVSRLAANIPLIQENVCPISFVDVPEDTYISGLLGIYELNRIDLLRDVFMWAYQRSCSLYTTTRQSLGEPDPFRMRYHRPISDVIQTIIEKNMDKKMADAFIKEQAPTADYEKFIEVVEIELMGLHEGNIARYQLSLEKFRKWLLNWS